MNKADDIPSPISHPQAIDLGLPSGTLWASCNMGATKPEEYGGFFAWGETVVKDRYDWKGYAHCEGDEKSCRHIGESICGTEHDAAYRSWGEGWQLPSFEQFWELVRFCPFEWTTLNSIRGGRFTGPNGNSIFLPAAGFRGGSKHNEIGVCGHYWLGTQDPCHNITDEEFLAYYLFFNSDSDLLFWDKVANFGSRCLGQSIRPVCKKL